MPHETTKDGARKRKRDYAEAELEIDLNAPEPASKKTRRKKRKEKNSKIKSKPKRSAAATSVTTAPVHASPTSPADSDDLSPHATKEAENSKSSSSTQPARSSHGIWIGNLAFPTTKPDVVTFFEREAHIEPTDILRCHLPTTKDAKGSMVNRGFAYVDFSSAADVTAAIACSERLIRGRRVLIKDARSFEGRPSPALAKTAPATTATPPTKRVFVGNLGFDVTSDDVRDLFAPAGLVEDVFLATFEDSAKCKGFGWVRFADVATAAAAVKGFCYVADEDSGTQGEEGTQQAKKKKKVWVNRLQGRPLRCEFAEDAQSRYKKRFHSQSREQQTGNKTTADEAAVGTKKPSVDERRAKRRERHDARNIAPGRALANTQRASGAIVPGKGKKISFD